MSDCTAHIVAPVKDSLVCEVLAWTPGTRGTVRARAYQLVLPERPTQEQLTAAFDKEKINMRGRILVRVNDAGREHGQIRAFNNRSFDVKKVVPTVVMRNEDYGRISRILADRTGAIMEFNIENRVYPEGKTSYKAIAEIPGSDKPGYL